MQIQSNGYTQANTSALENANIKDMANFKGSKSDENVKAELTVEEEIAKSAVEVSISMGAQIILNIINSQNEVKDNSSAQKNIMDFLSGKEVEGEFSLKDIGYEGKPITELSQGEAQELVSEEGFFGIENTANRVADFVLGFAGNDLENLEKSREGIVQGFEDANKMWGGELPEISHQTQARTLELIDERLSELRGETKAPSSTDDSSSVDITV